MRFELLAAYGAGVLLPVAEACRRRTDFSNLPAYVDDFLFGALLLVAARAVSTGRSWGRVLLAVAWAVICGAMYYSFFGQFDETGPTDVSGLSHPVVIGVKGAFYVIALIALVLSARRAVTYGREHARPSAA